MLEWDNLQLSALHRAQWRKDMIGKASNAKQTSGVLIKKIAAQGEPV